jgi:glycosyltransferase involved in cell wall biosynthesis
MSGFVPPFPIDFKRCKRVRSKAEARAELGIPEFVKVVSVASRLAPAKGLLELADILRGETDIILLLTGDGDPQVASQFRRRIAEALRGRVIYRPWAETASDFLDPADLLACPARNEGGPLVALEAMAHGTPVVMCRTGIAESVRVGGSHAVNYDFGIHALRRVLRFPDPEFYDEVAKTVREEYSEAQVANAWVRFLSGFRTLYR